MTLTKLVNGIRRNLTPQEERDTLALWEANKIAQEKKQQHDAYLQRKKAEFPSMAIQVEAIYKQLVSMSLKTDMALVPEMQDLLNKMNEFKAKYPTQE